MIHRCKGCGRRFPTDAAFQRHECESVPQQRAAETDAEYTERLLAAYHSQRSQR